ncbi:MAG: hypothetical protein ACI977_000407 [Candidatus Nanohaloarchaea archaeon]
MENRLDAIDYAVALAILLISTLAGLIHHFTPVKIPIIYMEITGLLIFLTGVGIMYLIARKAENRVGRHIKVVCIGALFFVMAWSHRIAKGQLELENYGLTDNVTSSFFVTLAVGGMILMTYGFYMVKEEVQLDNKNT